METSKTVMVVMIYLSPLQTQSFYVSRGAYGMRKTNQVSTYCILLVYPVDLAQWLHYTSYRYRWFRCLSSRSVQGQGLSHLLVVAE